MKVVIFVDGHALAPIDAFVGDSISFTIPGQLEHTSAGGEHRYLQTIKLMSEAPNFKLAKRIARQRGHL